MSIKLLVVAPLIMAAGVPGFHLGQSPDLADAVPSVTVLDRDAPSIAVKVTNRTRHAAQLTGWLNGNPAQADVPARTATVRLTWPATAEGWTRVTLALSEPGVAMTDTSDLEEHPVLVKALDYGGPGDLMLGAVSNLGTPDQGGGLMRAAGPNASVVLARQADMQADTAQTAADSDGGALPETGPPVQPYIVLGGGMLGFGLFILGLAWVLGRRSPTE